MQGWSQRGQGWFVLNARDAVWIRSEERGQDSVLEGRQDWSGLGFRLQILMPGQRNGMYHAEKGQDLYVPHAISGH